MAPGCQKCSTPGGNRALLAYPHFGSSQRPKRPKMPHRSTQDGPRGLPEGPRTAQMRPKTVQEAPKAAQEGPKW
eukprot:7260272-Pyramimonas_sp.AAC.1